MTFTQFLFPNGRRKPNDIVVPPDIEALADELSAAGWRWEIERFPDTQMVHADCCDEEEQLASTLVPNGPEVPGAIESLVRESHAAWLERGKPKAVPR